MKYYVVKVSNGSLQVQDITEHSDPEKALVAFHGECRSLWNAHDVVKATVKILDEQLDCWNGKMEVITHTPQVVEPTPEAENE